MILLRVRQRRRRMRHLIAGLAIVLICFCATVMANADPSKRVPPPPPPKPLNSGTSNLPIPNDQNSASHIPPPRRPPPPPKHSQVPPPKHSQASLKNKLPPPPPPRRSPPNDGSSQADDKILQTRKAQEEQPGEPEVEPRRPKTESEIPAIIQDGASSSTAPPPRQENGSDGVGSKNSESEATKQGVPTLKDKEYMLLSDEDVYTSDEKPKKEEGMKDSGNSPCKQKAPHSLPLASLGRESMQGRDSLLSSNRRSNNGNERIPGGAEMPTQPGLDNEAAMRTTLSSISRGPVENEMIEADRLRQNQQHQQAPHGEFSVPLSYHRTPHGSHEQHNGQNRLNMLHAQESRPTQYRGTPARLLPRQHQRNVMAPRMAPPRSQFFKSVLGSVEKGLDELVNIEGTISRRAQSLVSSAASYSSSKNVISSVSKVLSSKETFPSRQKRKNSTWNKKLEASSSKSPFAHLGKKYRDANEQKQLQPDVTSKLIRANGGASAPYGQSPNKPDHDKSQISSQGEAPVPTKPSAEKSQLLAMQRSQSVDQSKNPAEGGGEKLGQSVAYGGSNPYVQSTNLQRQPLPNKADPHSRESRIPWDSSPSGTPRPSTNRPTSFGIYDDEKTAWKGKISRFISRLQLPNPVNLFRFRKNKSYHYASMDAWKDEDDDSRRGFLGIFKKKTNPSYVSPRQLTSSSQGVGSGETRAPPLASLMDRSDGGKSTSLLSELDIKRTRSLAMAHATFDFVIVMLLILGIQQMPGLDSTDLQLSTSLADIAFKTPSIIASVLRNSVDSWAPFWFAYAYLTKTTRNILLGPKVTRLASSVASSVEDDSVYAQLYLRLVAALPMDTALPLRMAEGASSQVKGLMSRARLNSFVTMVLSLLVVMTLSVFRPALAAIGTNLIQMITLEEWRSWPIDWHALGGHYKALFRSLYLSVETSLANGLSRLLHNPLQIAFQASIMGSLLLATLIPRIETGRKFSLENDEGEDEAEVSTESAEQLSKLGASSANRLTLLSENGSVENALERWRLGRVTSLEVSSSTLRVSVFRLVGYLVLTGIVTLAPLLVPFFLTGFSKDSHTGLQWDSGLDVSIILLYAFFLLNKALKDSVFASTSFPYVNSFVSDLSKTLEEMRKSDRHTDIHFMASVSATAGLAVRDLWAAHTSKRAWAVRGASLECKNGEILAVLGDDGSGKTRLLTTIAETLVLPPKRSLTANKVRGLVAVGGLDASKWDNSVLKRRLGILLSDVRSVGDTATLFSGWTMEEILEPVDGSRASHTLSASERSSIILGLKITGLYSTLIPRLPSKLSTVVTANEEDLHPSPLRPRSTVLSPAEWAKLILAKVIAQTIADNDNAAASTDKVENALMGSVLLLDDATVLLSEVEEAKILRELRQTGAATVLTSNKWATGRFADRIVVMKDGAIVESGSHNELIARGPQQSVYAAKWHAMTMS